MADLPEFESEMHRTAVAQLARVGERLHLPYPLLCDAGLALTEALRLPTFSVAGLTLIRRLTLVGRGEQIERCLYPVFPPDADAENVLALLT